jgi:UDP-3-O-[3-hydroxymyristoyl] N-acetylglucosamine deacetylase / 3-hydroxyacyl-[acyl-carrier-protein] dehydratase
MKQATIQRSTTLEGIGLHSGKQVKLTFLPAPAQHGIRFQRVDLAEKPVIAADISRVVSTQRGTTIRLNDAQVSTVEHLLSAAMGMAIDNLLIEIDGPEVPIMDGTAMPFLAALTTAGREELAEDREFLVIEEPISFRDEVTGAELVALPADHFEVTAMIDFNSKVLGPQFAALTSLDDYQAEIAGCRTFVFLHEIEYLLSQNLIKGGDLDNAIVIADRVMNQIELDNLAKKLGKPSIKIEKEGILNTVQLRFPNEPARHKVLDIIGDLALVGRPILGKIVATKPGHTANIEFAKLLKTRLIEQRKFANVPKYDPNKPPIMDINGITKLLPHRFPFLLVDKIIELSDTHVVGLKNVTMNEPFFTGHFPDNPVFPGVLQIEAMAQVGGILALSLQDDPHGWDTYFLKIDQTKFKAKVLPGDTLLLKLELIDPIRRGIVHMQATGFVGNKVVSEAELTAQIVKRAAV